MSQVVGNGSEEWVLLEGIETKHKPVRCNTDDRNAATGSAVARNGLPHSKPSLAVEPSAFIRGGLAGQTKQNGTDGSHYATTRL